MNDHYIYSTADIARFYGLTPKGLAYYEDQGIIHPKRKEDSLYRIYTLEDCYSLYHSKLYKNAGLSLKEMATLEKDGSLEDILDSMHESVARQQEMLKIQTRINERILEIADTLKTYSQNGSSYTIVDRPEFYRLYVRNFDFEHTTDKKKADEFQLWNSYIPIDTASLLYKKEKLLSNNDVMNVNIANLISAKDFAFLKLEKSEQVEYYPSCKCIQTIISGDTLNIDTREWINAPMQYIQVNGYKLNGDVLTSMLIVTGDNESKIRYDLAWFPIE